MNKTVCVIVNYKNTDDTIQTLESLGPIFERGNLEVVVVDNASSSKSKMALEAFDLFPIELCFEEENIGFPAAVNQGVQFASKVGAEYLWLLNNDVRVQESALDFLLEVASADSIVSSLVVYYDEPEKIWFAGGEVLTSALVVKHSLKGKDLATSTLPREPFVVDYSCACSLLIPTELMNEVGGFDAELFLYAEDLDFCLKAKALGVQQLLQPKSVILHKVSRASGGEGNLLKEYYISRNSTVLIGRHVSMRPVRFFSYGLRFVWDLYRSWRGSNAGFRKCLEICTKAHRDAFANQLGAASADVVSACGERAEKL